MISFIVRQSIRYPGVVVALALTVVVYGFYVLSLANLDVFPEFSPSQVVIQTEAPGLSAELVERQVSQPIESALAGASGVEHIRSQSIPGLSVVTVLFREGSSAYPQPPGRERAVGLTRKSAASWYRAAGDDTANVLRQHRAGTGTHLDQPLPHGDPHAGGLDGAPSSAGGGRRSRGERVRRRSAAMAGAGRPREADALRPVDAGGGASRTSRDGGAGGRVRTHRQPAPHRERGSTASLGARTSGAWC